MRSQYELAPQECAEGSSVVFVERLVILYSEHSRGGNRQVGGNLLVYFWIDRPLGEDLRNNPMVESDKGEQ